MPRQRSLMGVIKDLVHDEVRASLGQVFGGLLGSSTAAKPHQRRRQVAARPAAAVPKPKPKLRTARTPAKPPVQAGDDKFFPLRPGQLRRRRRPLTTKQPLAVKSPAKRSARRRSPLAPHEHLTPTMRKVLALGRGAPTPSKPPRKRVKVKKVMPAKAPRQAPVELIVSSPTS